MDLTALLSWSWTLSDGMSVRVADEISAGTSVPSARCMRQVRYGR